MPKNKTKAHQKSTKPKQHHDQPPQKKQKVHHQPSQQAPARSWPRTADILLIGEGDFSFAHSLYTKHRASFRSLTATCYDSHDDLIEKYPQAAKNIEDIQASIEVDEDLPSSLEDLKDDDWNEVERPPAIIHYGIDARKLSSYKPLKKKRFDYIIFNFPHTGGLSKDVNRQVRANQSLLVDFFKSAKDVLRSDRSKVRGDDAGGGRIMATLFEREPYTLWNIRDLARHCGYVVDRSWRFEWDAWEGYQHARTIGNIRGKDDEDQEEDEEEGEWNGLSDVEEEEQHRGQSSPTTSRNTVGSSLRARPGKWRGEERDARTYMFSMKQEGDASRSGSSKRQERKNESDTDSD